MRIQLIGFFRLDRLGGGKAHGWKPRSDSHYRASSATKRRQNPVCCLSTLPEVPACAVRMEGKSNTDQLCVPELVGVSGLHWASLCVRRRSTSLAAPYRCDQREAICYQRKLPASRVLLAVCFCEPARCEINPLSIKLALLYSETRKAPQEISET